MRRLYHFPGGIRLPEHKAESTATPIAIAPVPRLLVLPVHQHIGEPAKPCVRVGEKVLKGEVIAQAEGYVSVPIHASSSGTIVAIEERAVPHPSSLRALCVVIETDSEDRWIPLHPQKDWQSSEPDILRKKVRDAGVVGLGGAGFPSFIKLHPGKRAIDTLILNGAECEPYITCDDMFMRERADQVIAGLRIMSHALQSRHNVIAIEDDKPQAINAIYAAVESLPEPARSEIEVAVIPTRYPTGGAKQLIQVLTGKEIPSGTPSLQSGIVCYNVATAASIYRAIELGEPLISRIVTVTGGAVAQPQNLEVRIGTSMADLLHYAGGLRSEPARYLMGGPMMGVTLPTLDLPVIKTANCLLAPLPRELGVDAEPLPCIRCGACADVCPARLLPQQLYWHARAKEFDKARDYKLFDCIECGCCAYVCPSHLPLVHYYRFAKNAIEEQEREREQADAAREHHQLRQQRHGREKAEREARLRHRQMPTESDSPNETKKATIQAALERAKAKKAAITEEKREE